MNKTEFTDLIKNPENLGVAHIDTLKNIIADYPYFSTAHILLAKALFNTNHYEYEKQLKITALSVGNRGVLHHYLYNENLEDEESANIMNVPIELKVEKVSKPDFEAGKEEEEALLMEAKSILNSSSLITEESFIDTELSEEKEDKIVEDSWNDELQSNLNTLDLNNNITNTTIAENTENIIVDELPLIEDVIEPNIVQNNNTAEAINNIDNSGTDYHLAETEGTLVRFVNSGNFLPDFDEDSLFVDDSNIETITKSVLPNENIELEEKYNTSDNKEVEDNNILEEEIIGAEDELKENVVEEVTEDEVTEEELIVENENTLLPIENIALEKQGNFIAENIENEIKVEEDEIDEIEIIGAEDELKENVVEEVTEEEVTEEEPIVENDDYSLNENSIINTAIEEPIIENNILPIETVASENVLVENHGFFEWLNKNKSNSNLVELSSSIAVEKTNYEDFEFTEKIKQLIKSKAQLTLGKSIAFETAHAHDNIAPFERKTNIEAKQETALDEPIENETENTVDELTTNEDEIVFNEIESFNINISEPIIEEQKNIVIEDKPNESQDSIYNTEVISILPDFEALKMQEEQMPYLKFDKKDGMIPSYEGVGGVDEVSGVGGIGGVGGVVEVGGVDEVKEEEATTFITAPINENDFEKLFGEVYIPLEKNTIVTEIKVEIAETVIIKTVEITEPIKSDVESILEKFIRESPSITRPKSEFFNPANVAKMSAEEKNEIVSETLANIYLKQGLIKKAISTYEKLSLIYPHKITYFAALINKLKTEHNIN